MAFHITAQTGLLPRGQRGKLHKHHIQLIYQLAFAQLLLLPACLLIKINSSEWQQQLCAGRDGDLGVKLKFHLWGEDGPSFSQAGTQRALLCRRINEARQTQAKHLGRERSRDVQGEGG